MGPGLRDAHGPGPGRLPMGPGPERLPMEARTRKTAYGARAGATWDQGRETAHGTRARKTTDGTRGGPGQGGDRPWDQGQRPPREGQGCKFRARRLPRDQESGRPPMGPGQVDRPWDQDQKDHQWDQGPGRPPMGPGPGRPPMGPGQDLGRDRPWDRDQEPPRAESHGQQDCRSDRASPRDHPCGRRRYEASPTAPPWDRGQGGQSHGQLPRPPQPPRPVPRHQGPQPPRPVPPPPDRRSHRGQSHRHRSRRSYRDRFPATSRAATEIGTPAPQAAQTPTDQSRFPGRHGLGI